MGAENAPKKEGREAGKAFREETRKEEREVEAAKGSDLQKGQERVEERAESAKGRRGVKPAG